MRHALALATLLILGLVFWLWTPRASNARAEPEPPRVELADAPIAPEAQHELANADQLSPHEGAERAERSRVELGGEPASDHELWIVSAATQMPLAGARAHVMELDATRAQEWFPQRFALAAGVRRVESETEPRSSDEHGRVRLAAPRERCVAIARHGELFAVRWFDASAPRPWKLELEPAADWVVLVRDVHGQPVADLRVRCYGEGGGELGSLTTNAAGIARLEHARHVLAQIAGESFTLVPRALLRKPVTAVLRGRVPPAVATEITLPELGAAEVVLLDPDGRPWSNAALQVWLRDASGVRAEQRAEQQQIQHWSGAAASHRVHAEVGLVLEAGAGAHGLDEDSMVRGAGPSRAAELVRFEVRTATEHPLARMRLLGPDGAPLARARVQVEWRAHERERGRTSSSSGRTDEAAVLEWPLPRQHAELKTVLTIKLADDPTLHAVLAIPTEAAQGWLELGDVRLDRGPVIAAGRVVDAAGAPVAGAQVSIRSSLPAASGIFEIPRWRVKSDAQGAFELRSVEQITAVKACAHLGHSLPYTDEWVEGAPGRTDYVLVVSPPCGARGRVLLPESVDPRALTVTTRSRDFWNDALQLQEDGSWHARALLPGDWTADVRPAGSFHGKPLGSTSFIAVAGEVVRAPDIDLREMRVLRVSVTNEEGEPLEATGHYAAPQSDERSPFAARGGKARLLTNDARVDASFEAPGYRSAHVVDLQDGAIVVLEPGLELRVRLRDARALPAQPFQLVASLGEDGAPAAFDADGLARLSAPVAGEQAVWLAVRDPRRGDAERYRVPLRFEGKPLSFAHEVHAQGTTPELALELDAQLVAEAVRELERR